jgi:hypothetical chaperone protein
MRSLKSLLGSALMQEKTAVYDGLVSFEDIIARFLRELAVRASRELGQIPEQVVIGRPVHFVDDDSKRDERAEDSLRHRGARGGFSRRSLSSSNPLPRPSTTSSASRRNRSC